MFWEIKMHKYKQSLDDINYFIQTFFCFAANSEDDFFNKAAFARCFPTCESGVLKAFTGRSANAYKFKSAVENLFKLSYTEQTEIYNAIVNDFDYISGDRTKFDFSVKKLPRNEREIVHDIFFYFYNEKFGKACGIELNNIDESGINKTQLKNHFFLANDFVNHVCPVCLSQMSIGKRETHLEHYLPKSIYPALIFHPFNLYYACNSCNTVYKKAKDTLLNGISLNQIFIPYLEPAVDFTEIIIERANMTDIVKLKAKDKNTATQNRIDNLNRLFELEERWSSNIECYYGQFRCSYKDKSITRDELKEKLSEQTNYLVARSREFPEKYIESVYMKWIYTRQLDAFYDSLFTETFIEETNKLN